MIYLASPFSHDDQAIQILNYHSAFRFVARQLNRGVNVFSPIVYGYPFHASHGFKGDAKTWELFNNSMIERCNEIWVLQLLGWEYSIGIQEELKFAKIVRKPVRFVDESFDG